ncbi:hypothetical protein PbB2_01718 [Candidatus Phycosocius bacilliformis]|uniref:DUF1330 domain-containing protein n=1 Tax=Candidatus Phycosocius bacilliformis TaxID=1445552 RepID=A0A2P2EAE3_9PROT|nr:DUF1330 domain-containing protein [Candidatus Phycosocius bacilliformis]GBF58047.1 hypothetical protein PbB2_01718 [Candidatus Phycosocius bacilliformis]
MVNRTKTGLSAILRIGVMTCSMALMALMPTHSLAQTASPANPGYLVVIGKTTDRVKIADYAASLPPIYASLDGRYLAVGGPGRGVSWLEGPWTDRSLIFAAFPSRAGVDAFWWGEAYRAVVRKRDNAGVFSVVAVEGRGPVSFDGAGGGYLIVMTGPLTKPDAAYQAASAQAAQALKQGVEQSGGRLLTGIEAGALTPLEGDSFFDRLIVAAWPSQAARDAYVVSPAGVEASRLRAATGLSIVAAANAIAVAAPSQTPRP